MIPHATIDSRASEMPLVLPSRILFLSSDKFVDAKNIPMKTAIIPIICRGASVSWKRKTASRVVITDQLAEIGETTDTLPF